ncbi:MAG: hypothetical protein R3Y67_10520 [Eubacteriales bacterium]
MSVTIPESVTSIGETIFLSCDNLTITTPSPTVATYCVEQGIDHMLIEE